MFSKRGDILIECPYCGKDVRDDFAHCRHCGSMVNGEAVGDFATDMLNVFRIDGQYIYLFSRNGSQVVLKAGSIEELARLVEDRNYPWEFRDWKGSVSHAERKAVEIPEVKTDFLKASALKGPEVIPTSSARRKRDEDESYVPEYEVEEVSDESGSKEEDESDCESEVEREGNAEFSGGMDLVVQIPTSGSQSSSGNLPDHVSWTLGPDTSQRARNLRASIFK